MLSTLQGNTGLKVPLADDQMLIFSQNKFDPSCCDGPWVKLLQLRRVQLHYRRTGPIPQPARG